MDTKQIVSICKDYSRSYQEIEKYVFAWARKNKTLMKTIDVLNAMEEAEDNQFPKGWHRYQGASFALSQALAQDRALAQIVKRHQLELSSQSLAALRHWRETPVHWAFFTIRGSHGSDLYEVIDGLTEEKFLLYSPGITSLQGTADSREAHYLALVFHNGTCWQTMGNLHFFHITEADMDFYCRALDERLYVQSGLTGVINHHFIDFFTLDRISVIPQIHHGGERVALHWKALRIPGIDTTVLPGDWDIEEFKGDDGGDALLRFRYQGPDGELLKTPVPHSFLGNKSLQEFWEVEDMQFSELYIDKGTEEVGMHALTLAGHRLLACLLATRFPQIDPMHFEPDRIVSMSMLRVIDDIPTLSLPWATLMTPFDRREREEPDAEGDLEGINTPAQRIHRCPQQWQGFCSRKTVQGDRI